MILSSLVEYYEALAAKGEIEKNGWSKVKISFAVSLDGDGNLVGISDLRREQERGKKKIVAPRELPLPAAVKRASGVASNFLWDNCSYIFGADEKGKPRRALECFEACKAKHQELLRDSDDPAAVAMLRFFETWKPEETKEHPLIKEYWSELSSNANITFRVKGKFIAENPAVCRIWDDYYSNTDSEKGLCLVTGRHDPIARLHPSIKGIAGAQSAGASLVSFNAPAYCSYDKEQGENSPVGEYAAFAYTSALNHLIADYQHKETLGDTTIVYWAKKASAAHQDVFSMFMKGGAEGIDDTQLNAIINKLAVGKAVEWQDIEILPEDEFYILGLSPNAARLSVRFFLRSTFGKIAENLNRHYENIKIVHAPEAKNYLSLWNLISETVNQKSKDKKPSPQLAGSLAKAVLEGLHYPETLYSGAQLRIRAERRVNYGRASIIKAYLIENAGWSAKEGVTVSLNEDCNFAPYVLGRLFSILEGVQNAANPGINATIRDRYFNSACATPAVIFPILIKLSQNHSRKLSYGLRVYYEKQIVDMMSKLEGTFPDRLNLKEQGSFQLGYYHQTQRRFEKKDTENAEEIEEREEV